MKIIGIASFVLTLMAAPLCADNNVTYLALGDSVPFGMNVTLLPPFSSQTPTQGQFIGYPEVIAAAVHISEVNVSCPGETSGSFLDVRVLDNGCNSPHFVSPQLILDPFKTTIGLHTPYLKAQMDFAEDQLKANKSINLVLPYLQQCGDPTCVQKVVTPVLQNYAWNLTQILTRIRAQYHGKLVLLTYYSPSPEFDALTQELNSVMTQVAMTPAFAPIRIADGFTAFQLASQFANHDACKAGLLIKLPPDNSSCDIHPSALGRNVLAAVVGFAAR